MCYNLKCLVAKTLKKESFYMEKNKLTGINKLPWGVISGTCAMIWSFVTIGLVVVYVISAMMYAEVGGDDGLTRSWWIIPLFVLEGLTVVGFVVSTIFYVKRRNAIIYGVASKETTPCDEQTEVAE